MSTAASREPSAAASRAPSAAAAAGGKEMVVGQGAAAGTASASASASSKGKGGLPGTRRAAMPAAKSIQDPRRMRRIYAEVGRLWTRPPGACLFDLVAKALTPPPP